MDARRNFWLTSTILALALVLTACAGGSGSSGFDITENAAIDQALATAKCVDFQGLDICPADQPPAQSEPSRTPTRTATPPTAMPGETPTAATPTATRTRTPTPSPSSPPSAMAIDTSLSNFSSIDCPAAPLENPCLIDFTFVPHGFPPDATYRVAQRDSADAAWTILSPPSVVADTPEASLDNQISLGPSAAPTGSVSELQLAVLVFIGEPQNLPTTVEQLGDSGAVFAYVTPLLGVNNNLAPQQNLVGRR